MKKHLIQILVALSALLPAAAAVAADLDTMPPPPPPSIAHLRPAAYDWSGAYIGGYIGMACVDGIMTNNTPVPPIDYLNAGCGFKGGGLAGYNIQMDEVVFGVEGNLETTSNITHATLIDGDFNYRYDYIGRLNGRVGWAMDTTLFFVQGGAAYGMGHLTDNVSTAPVDETAGHWGWSVGAGVEHAVTDNFRLRFDYLYTHFYDATYSGCGACNVTGHENEHEVRAAAIWAF